MDLDFYVRVRTCKKRVTGKQPLIKLILTLDLIIKAKSGQNFVSFFGQIRLPRKWKASMVNQPWFGNLADLTTSY